MSKKSRHFAVVTIIICSLTTTLLEGAPRSLEVDLAKIQRVSEVNRTINVLEYGAIADGKSHKLHTLFESQAQIDAKYGKGKYTLEDEADFVAISQALDKAKRNANEQLPGEAFGLWTIHLPTGVYVVNRTIDLKGVCGLTIRGDGHNATRIIFNAPSVLYYLEMTEHIWFREFAIESKPSSKSTAIHLHNTIVKDPKKEIQLPTWKVVFDTVGFSGFYESILTTGDTMCSEVVLLKCRFVNCLKGLHLKNVQSLNFSFFGCDFEPHSPDAYFAPFKSSDAVFIHAEAGGCVNVYGGSILLHGTTLLLEPNYDICDNPINMITGLYNFHGIAWEQWSAKKPLLFDKKGDKPMRARVNIDNCRVHQLMAARGADLGALKNGMDVTIRNSNFTFGNIQLYIDENTKDQWGSLTVDNSKFIDYYEVRSEAAKDMPNVNHHIRYINSAIRPADHTAFNGKSKINQMDFDIRPGPTVSAKLKRIDYTEPAGTLKGINGQIVLRIPRHGLLTRIGVVKTSSESVSYSITDVLGKVKFGKINTDNKIRKGFIKDIELLNNGTDWDGSIKIKVQGENMNGTGWVFCEYF